ncbi:MAG: hypothetical protein CM1200mP17_14900 [Woeseia sp.]|nr:MAG: hypothetical protein CM1200mP17_14900 [Woeseia sp.]
MDKGLLRLNEGDQVMEVFSNHINLNVIRVDAEEIFLEKLKGVKTQRKSEKSLAIPLLSFRRAGQKLDNVKWLAQGTIYPDVIESAGQRLVKLM